MVEHYEDDYKTILDKISQDKEERQRNLNELKRRKREIEYKGLIDPPVSYTPTARNTRQTLSSERKETNKKVYRHLLSPDSKLPKQLKPKHLNRFEEDEANKINQVNNQNVNKLKLLDKRARYAVIVKEIFAPTVDPQKRIEIQARTQTVKTRSAFNSRGNSLEPPHQIIVPSLSHTNLKSSNAFERDR